MSETKKEVQFDAKNEQTIIGLMLVDQDVRVRLVRTLRTEDFIGERHQSIFSGLSSIVSQGLSYTEPTLVQVSPGDTGGIPYLAKLRELVVDRVTPLRNNLDTHLRILHFERTKHNLLVKDLPAIHEMLEDEECNQEKLKRELRRVGALAEMIKGQTFTERGKSLSDAYKADQRAVVGNRTTGYRILDFGTQPADKCRLTMGTAPGGVGVLGARPSTGKSMFSTQIGRRLAKRGIKVNICAFEMNKIPTTHLLIPQWVYDQRQRDPNSYPDLTITDLISRRYKSHKVIDDSLEGLFGDGNLGIMRNPIFMVNDTKSAFGRRIHPSEMNERNLDLLENEIANDPADVWIFDLWERLMRSKDQADIAVGLERMQAMAHYYQKFFLIVQQIGRAYTKSSTSRDSNAMVRPPRMEDFKNSGAYEEVADWILVLHRPALYRSIPDDLLELYCVKQRLGAWPWGVAFNFDGSRAFIENGHRIDVNLYEDDKASADGGSVY